MEYAVKMENISKSFSGVKVLDNVNFELRPGEIHALVGENGAGKSTLIKILSGCYIKDSGNIYVNDVLVDINNPTDSKEKGIQCIYQELSLVPHLSVANNIFLGQEKSSGGIIDQRYINSEAQKLMDDLGVEIDVRNKIMNVGIGEQFFTEICRCLVGNSRIVIMDEPTSAMTPFEYDSFLKTVKILRQKDISAIYISHRLDEIFEICDSVTVLRDGKVVSSDSVNNISLPKLIKNMIGKEATGHYTRIKDKDYSESKVVLELDNVSSHKLKNVSFELHEGEVLGVTGLLGAGKTELANVLFGIDELKEGSIKFHDNALAFDHPRTAMQSDFALVPEDRKGKGLFLNTSIKKNMSIVNLRDLEKASIFVDKLKEKKFGEKLVNEFGVKAASVEQKARYLSGGNQQKIVLAKWIARKPQILILDEPTRGIDVGSKEEIYEIIKNLARQGMSVLLLSSEMPEVIALSHRLIVMHDGELRGELLGSMATQENILLLATEGQNE